MRFLLRAICRSQSAVLPAVKIIEHQAQDHPDKEADPVHYRQAGHEQEACENRDDRRKRSAGGAESARPVRLPIAKNKHACRDKSEREQGADIRKIGKSSDVERSEEHTSELSHSSISYAVFC